MVSQSIENKDFGVLESHRLKAPSFRRKRKVFDLPFFCVLQSPCLQYHLFPSMLQQIYGSVPLL